MSELTVAGIRARLWHLIPLLMLVACSTEKPLPDPSCLSIDPALAEATMAAIEAWEPLPLTLNVDIGGECENKVKYGRASDPKFKRARAYAFKNLDGWGNRAETEIRINPAARFTECEMQQVITHELYHFFGPNDHNPDPGSLMQVELWGCVDAEITAADRAKVESYY